MRAGNKTLHVRMLGLITFAFLLLFETSITGDDAVRLSVEVDRAQGVARLNLPVRTNYWDSYDVQVSTNLQTWSNLGRFMNHVAEYADELSSNAPSRYFRALETPSPREWTNYWANQVNRDTWNVSKFLIFTNDPSRVFFHSGSILHYDFASRHFPELAQIGPAVFDDRAIHPDRQEIVLGGIVIVPSGEQTYGVEFVSAEPFSPERIAELFRTVTNRVYLPGLEPFLLPTALQLQVVSENIEYFRAHGIRVRQWKEFLKDSSVQSEGWTLGILKYIPAGELAQAWAELTPDTILITDEVPRDLPPIAGLISLTASSPNSHTVIRLTSQSLPYYDWPSLSLSNISNLLGMKVLFATQLLPVDPYETGPLMGPKPKIYLSELTSLTEPIRAELSSREEGPRTNTLPGMEHRGLYTINADSLKLTDLKYFGSKAANYGILRKSIPEATPRGIAFSFDLWLDYMAQRLPSGRTLRESIDEEIKQGTNSVLLAEQLNKVRKLIETADFTAERKAAIISALSSPIFTKGRKIRFRSSSNAEDLPEFSAAGVYDSYSGCLLDDLQGTNAQVCLCDPRDDKARSVFRAMKKVYASLYNDQAYSERRRYGIDEATVGMGLLVHHSFPDEEELANGVATLEGSVGNYGATLRSMRIVSQRGAISVTNPTGLDRPERYEGYATGIFGSLYPQIAEYSTIRPRGTTVLGADSEYLKLRILFERIFTNYSAVASAPELKLNFEFKKTAAGFQVKQVRRLHDGESTAPTIIMPGKLVWNTYQGGNIPNYTNQPTLESTHQLKSVWTVEFEGGASGTLANGIGGLARCNVQYIDGDQVVSNSFVLQSSDWLFRESNNGIARSLFTSSEAKHGFVLDSLLPISSPQGTPFVEPVDIMAQASIPGQSGIAQLVPANMEKPYLQPSLQTLTNAVTINGLTITTSYMLGVHPKIPIVGMGPTMSLAQWKETEIAGLTSKPFKLTGYFSQTYSASRHNFQEYFLFEPRLEQGLAHEIVEELAAKDIKQVRVGAHIFGWVPGVGNVQTNSVDLVGFDGRSRPL